MSRVAVNERCVDSRLPGTQLAIARPGWVVRSFGALNLLSRTIFNVLRVVVRRPRLGKGRVFGFRSEEGRRSLFLCEREWFPMK